MSVPITIINGYRVKEKQTFGRSGASYITRIEE